VLSADTLHRAECRKLAVAHRGTAALFCWHVRNCSVLWQFKQRICGCDVTAGRFFSWSRIACNLKVHCRIHNSSSCPLPLIPHLPTSILQLSFHVRLCLPGFPNKTLCAFLFFHNTCNLLLPSRPCCHHLNNIKSWNPRLWYFLHSLVTSSLRTSYLPQHPILEHPVLSCDRFSHACNKTGKIMLKHRFSPIRRINT
jgi:hypothetical protein